MSESADEQYLALLRRVIDHGDKRVDRTGVGTLSVFGATVRFNLNEAAPILTTKRVYWKTAVKEMLWFLSGGTNLQSLLKENVRIWSDWPLARYLRETGVQITQEEFERRIIADDDFALSWGDLGPVYGKQWRHWVGADGREFDQIAGLLKDLRTNPTSRRMLFHAWNVAEIDRMALPPCHMVYQYHVANGKLSCLLFQRSVDLILGAPFNWVGATALQLMLAQQARLELGDLIWVGGDVHVYLNHLPQAESQLKRAPKSPPTMRLVRHPPTIDEYRIDDFAVEGYAPHPPIAADVAV
jgi:thymidylate synthase